MTATLSRQSWHPVDENDDQSFDNASCRTADPTLFFPEDEHGEEPAYPPPDAKAVCERCPIRALCLERHMDEEFGIYGGMTGFQRGLLTKKIVRKRCVGCGSEDLVANNSVKKEICLACGQSWDIL